MVGDLWIEPKRKRDRERAAKRAARGPSILRNRYVKNPDEGLLTEAKWRLKAIASDVAACALLRKHHSKREVRLITRMER